jgi:hypothetical protein
MSKMESPASSNRRCYRDESEPDWRMGAPTVAARLKIDPAENILSVLEATM